MRNSDSRYSSGANILYFIYSICAQVIGALVSNAVVSTNSIFIFVAVHSVTAFLISVFLKLPAGWRWFNLLLFPSILGYEYYGLPSWLIITAFLLSFLIYLPAIWSRIPYYPTSHKTYQVISDLISKNKKGNINFIDIGCGNSSLLLFLAKQHPDVEFFGNEISPLAYLISKIRTIRSENIKISFQSFWNEDFGKYTIVYAFLSPPPMAKLWEKVKSEMKSGTVFISNSFQTPVTPQETVEINDKRMCRLLVYKI